MRLPFVLCCVVCLAATGVPVAWAGVAEPRGIYVSFDSVLTTTSAGVSVTSHVRGKFLIEASGDEASQFQGSGRLRYVSLSGFPATPSDGVLRIFNLQISPGDGTVVLDLFPGDPKPAEWAGTTQFHQWFGAFGFMHLDEFLGGAGYRVVNWDYPVGEVFARKTYDRSMALESTVTEELTTIELTHALELPRIDEILVESMGTSVENPETGKDIKLSADLFVPSPFEIQRCTWTGNNFTGPGEGDIENDCQWTYTPEADQGPKPETYGDKDVQLIVVYGIGAQPSALTQSRTKEYQVFFGRDEDDNTNKRPNWFDYWGDDGAVPTMDAPDVSYDASQTSFAYASGGTVYMGPAAATVDGPLTVPSTELCPGGSFPGGSDIDLAALTLAHERKHIETAGLGGTDTDGDGVPDTAEAGTSTNDPDSCSLATVIHSDYATYGDDEFIARMAELGVVGVPENDWALPGRKASMAAAAAASLPLPPAGSGWATFERPDVTASIHALAGVQGPGTILTGTYDSNGLDTDDDTLFNALLLDVEVDVPVSGFYSVLGWLADDEGVNIVWARNDVDLTPGTHTVQLAFDGPMLNRAGVTLPFEVSLVQVYAIVGKHQVLKDFADNVHVTAFISADFDSPAATFGGVVSEMPVDLDMDGLYDRLDLAIDVSINDPGEYEVSAVLKGVSMSLAVFEPVDPAAGAALAGQVSMPLGTVVTPVLLSFDGASIFYHREDGPFQIANLKLTNLADDGVLDFQEQAWMTSAYLHSDFQQSGVAIDENSYTDMGGELDEQGKFSTLDVTFVIDSMVPGPYLITARLEDDLGSLIAATRLNANLGGFVGSVEAAMVQLSFDGAEILAAGRDGPYRLANVTVIADSGLVFDQNPRPYWTAPYAVGDFSAGTTGEEIIFIDSFE